MWLNIDSSLEDYCIAKLYLRHNLYLDYFRLTLGEKPPPTFLQSSNQCHGYTTAITLTIATTTVGAGYLPDREQLAQGW